MRGNAVLIRLAGASTVILLHASLTPVHARSAQADEPRVIEIMAKRFEFEPARIEIDEGETVRLILRSADGMHGIGIKKFKVSEEIPRDGMPVTIEFTATASGEFQIACSAYFGKGHESMKGVLVVKAREKTMSR
jgi:cytochrome c oxidase subunit 2